MIPGRSGCSGVARAPIFDHRSWCHRIHFFGRLVDWILWDRPFPEILIQKPCGIWTPMAGRYLPPCWNLFSIEISAFELYSSWLRQSATCPLCMRSCVKHKLSGEVGKWKREIPANLRALDLGNRMRIQWCIPRGPLWMEIPQLQADCSQHPKAFLVALWWSQNAMMLGNFISSTANSFSGCTTAENDFRVVSLQKNNTSIGKL